MFPHKCEVFPRPRFWTQGKKLGKKEKKENEILKQIFPGRKRRGYVCVCSEQDNKYEKCAIFWPTVKLSFKRALNSFMAEKKIIILLDYRGRRNAFQDSNAYSKQKKIRMEEEEEKINFLAPIQILWLPNLKKREKEEANQQQQHELEKNQ